MTLIYQWSYEDDDLVGQTGPTLTLDNVQPGQAGGYTVAVHNQSGWAGSEPAILTVVAEETGDPPTIMSQPQNLTMSEGGEANFSVTASGTEPLEYQWRFNGSDLGQTSATLNLIDVQSSQAGAYTVVVGNRVGWVESQSAILTVIEPEEPAPLPPTITVQPQSETILVGEPIRFEVGVQGTEPLRYQWYFQDAPILNETRSALFIPACTSPHAGHYRAVVSNEFGKETTDQAELIVRSGADPLISGVRSGVISRDTIDLSGNSLSVDSFDSRWW